MEHKTDMNIPENLNNTSMKKHKTDMNVTEKLNSTSLTKHKTDINVTEKLNMIEHKTEHNYTLVKQAMSIYESNKPQISPRRRLTKICNQQLTSIIIYTRNRKIRRTMEI